MTSSSEPIARAHSLYILIPRKLVESVDFILDRDCGPMYHEQPLAQDWARVCKRDEEHGEAVAELILATGQNPRKGQDDKAARRLLEELADRAMTSVYAMQHFAKDTEVVNNTMLLVMDRHYERLMRS